METPEKLVIEIQNKQPLELVEMADCLLSAGAEYQRYLALHEGAAASMEVKLLVREVRQGSAVFELVAGCYNVFPQVIEHGRTLVGFLVDLKKAVKYLKHEETERPANLDKPRLERISRMVQPTARDNPEAQINIFYVERGGKLADTLNISMAEANVIQNKARREIGLLREPTSGIRENAVLYFFQTRDDAKSAAGDRAIIESLSRSPVKTKFATEEAKARVLGIEGNIFHHAFVVDVRVETIDERPVLYTVLKLNEVMPRPAQEPLPLLDNPATGVRPGD